MHNEPMTRSRSLILILSLSVLAWAAILFGVATLAHAETTAKAAQAEHHAKKKPKKPKAPKPLKLIRTEQWFAHYGVNEWWVYSGAKKTTVQAFSCDRGQSLPPLALKRGWSYYQFLSPRHQCLLFDVRQDKKKKFRMIKTY